MQARSSNNNPGGNKVKEKRREGGRERVSEQGKLSGYIGEALGLFSNILTTITTKSWHNHYLELTD